MSLSGTLNRSVVLAGAIALLTGVAQAASAAGTFRGKWSSTPPRCEQINGEVDVLTVTSSELSFYEIGCKISKPQRSHDGVRFAARCYKGGSPESSGSVVIRRLAPDTIALSLHGLFWPPAEPAKIHRCAAR